MGDSALGSSPVGAPAHPEKPAIAAKAKSRNIHVSPAVLDAARKDGDELLRSLRTTAVGLTQAEAEERARTAGPNEVAQEKPQGWFHPPSENRPQPAGDPAGGSLGDFLRHRRRARRHRDGHDGGAERGTPLLAGGPGGRGGGQAQGHDPRDGHRRAGRQGRRDAAARPGARGHHPALRGRHDSGRRARALLQGSLREPREPYRRVASGREVPRPRDQGSQLTHRAQEHLLHGDQRRERHGDGGGGGNRGPTPISAAWPARSRESAR